MSAFALPVTDSVITAQEIVGILPLHGSGWLGRPGLLGHRSGRDWSPAFDAVHHGLVEDGGPGRRHWRLRLESEAIDTVAHLALSTEVELLDTGLLRVRATVRNTGSEPFEVTNLEPALAVPRPGDRGPRLHRPPRSRAPPPAAPVRHRGLGSRVLGWSPRARLRHPALRRFHRLRVQARRRVGGSRRRRREPGRLRRAVHHRLAPPARRRAAPSRRGGPRGGGELLALRGWSARGGPAWTKPPPASTTCSAPARSTLDGPGPCCSTPGRRPTSTTTSSTSSPSPSAPHRSGWNGSCSMTDGSVDAGTTPAAWVTGSSPTDVWPEGLHPLVDRVHALGMEFGLWFEPEMVNLDSELAEHHPEWLLQTARGPGIPSRYQHVLDLGHADAYAHVRDQISALVDEYDIAYLKWDHNRPLVDAGHWPTGRPGRARADRGGPAAHGRAQGPSPGAGDRVVRRRRRPDRPGHPRRWSTGSGSRTASTPTSGTASTRPPGCSCRRSCSACTSGPAATTPPAGGSTLGFRAGTAIWGHLGIEWDLSTADAAELDRLQAVGGPAQEAP